MKIAAFVMMVGAWCFACASLRSQHWLFRSGAISLYGFCAAVFLTVFGALVLRFMS